MSNETQKAFYARQQYGDFDRYFKGHGIDIGCGKDPLPGAVAWDYEDGDAQFMAGVPDASFDFVYSSHCLEHIGECREALSNWARICRVGGHVFVTVPEWTLYEYRTWPSRWNSAHKASFALIFCPRPTCHPHYTVQDMASICPALSLVDARLEMEGYRTGMTFLDQTSIGAQAQATFIWQKLVQ
jgi:SAM-dependent methyltransferase